MSSDMRSLAEMESWMNRTCPTCRGSRMDGMGNPPCPECNGWSQRKPEPQSRPKPSPEERRNRLKELWSPEQSADLESFYGKVKKQVITNATVMSPEGSAIRVIRYDVSPEARKGLNAGVSSLPFKKEI